MSSSSPLTGIILVDCAKANAVNGVQVAAERCGYGEDTAAFRKALSSACADMDVEVTELSDLITETPRQRLEGMEVAPDTPSDL